MTDTVPAGIAEPVTSQLTIDRRLAGPPGIANGGYLAGRIGGPGPARVVLTRPVPLEKPLTLATTPARATVLDGEQELIHLAPGRTPKSVSWAGTPADLDRLPQPYALDAHPFPGCFVCGPANEDGLGLIFKRIDNGVGAVFTPATTDPIVSITGALDCAAGWASYVPGEAGVLGTIEYAIVADVTPGEPLVVIAEPVDRRGRTRRASSSVFTANGDLIGTAATIWIDILHPSPTSVERTKT